MGSHKDTHFYSESLQFSCHASFIPYTQLSFSHELISKNLKRVYTQPEPYNKKGWPFLNMPSLLNCILLKAATSDVAWRVFQI